MPVLGTSRAASPVMRGSSVDECRARDLVHVDFIEFAAFFQITEALHLDRRGGDNEFAAVLDRNAVLSAKLLGFAIPSAA